MANRPNRFRPAHQRSAARVDRDRGNARDRGYVNAWDKAARSYRLEHPLCEYCQVGAFGPRRISPATRVDHLYPQRRFAGVFWETGWWVASCDDCDAAKQALEHRGKAELDALALRLGRRRLPA